MLTKAIVFCGAHVTLACDGRCDKAWGGSTRPRRQLSDDEDDYVYEGDDALGTAPVDPGTYEGNHGKPSGTALAPENADLMNKWCARECERSGMFEAGEPIELPDLKSPSPNIPRDDDG